MSQGVSVRLRWSKYCTGTMTMSHCTCADYLLIPISDGSSRHDHVNWCGRCTEISSMFAEGTPAHVSSISNFVFPLKSNFPPGLKSNTFDSAKHRNSEHNMKQVSYINSDREIWSCEGVAVQKDSGSCVTFLKLHLFPPLKTCSFEVG